MTFATFILYVLFTFLRPFEFIPGLVELRPMLLLWSIAFVFALAQASSTRVVAGRPLHFALIGSLVAIITLSAMIAAGGGYAMSALSDFSASAMLMTLALLNLTTLARLRTTCIAIAACLVVLAAVGIVSYHTGFMTDEFVIRQEVDADFSQEPPLDTDPDAVVVPAQDTSGRYMWRVRSVGFLADPNDFAQTMVMVLPFLLDLVVPGRFVLTLLRVGPPAATLGYAIFLTHSRGAMVGIAIMVLLELRRRMGGARAAVMIGLMVAAAAFTSFGGGRAFSSQEQSAAERIEAWWVGLGLLRAYPLFGAGYGRFNEHHYLTAHNSFVLCFAELGLLGLFCWMAIIVVAYQGLNQAQAAADGLGLKGEAHWASLLRASLVGTLACGWFLSRTYAPSLYMLFALCIAGWHCASQAVKAAGGSALSPRPWPWAAVCASAASIAAVYFFVWLQRAGA